MWVLVCKRVLKSSAVHGTSTTAPLIHSISPSKGTFCPLLQSFEKLWQKIATLVISEALHRVRHCNCFFCFIAVSRQKSVQMQSSCFTFHPWLAASLLLASSLLHPPNRSNKLIGHQSGIVWKHIWHIGPSLFKACKCFRLTAPSSQSSSWSSRSAFISLWKSTMLQILGHGLIRRATAPSWQSATLLLQMLEGDHGEDEVDDADDHGHKGNEVYDHEWK